jgi:hypothetical protein
LTLATDSDGLIHDQAHASSGKPSRK